MSVVLKEKIPSPMDWMGSDLSKDQSWILEPSQSQIEDLGIALEGLKAPGKSDLDFTKEDFPLPSWRGLLSEIAEELENGRGFCVLRGLPVDQFDENDVRRIYFGIGLNLGKPVQQNFAGEMLGTVASVADPAKKESRVYETNAYLPYHTDPSDVVGLLSLQKAKLGGVSSLVSVASVYNEMLKRCPELLGLFYRPWYYAHMGEDQPILTPLMSYHKGKLAFRYLRQYIELGHEEMKAPLSAVEVEALEQLDAITLEEGRRLDMMLEPGDLQFANNYMVLHSRTSFEDFEDPAKRRKLLRLWLKMPNARELSSNFPGRNGFGE